MGGLRDSKSATIEAWTGFAAAAEVARCWLNGERRGQKREIGIVNLPSFGNRNALSRTADVCHPNSPLMVAVVGAKPVRWPPLAMLQSRLSQFY